MQSLESLDVIGQTVTGTPKTVEVFPEEPYQMCEKMARLSHETISPIEKKRKISAPIGSSLSSIFTDLVLFNLDSSVRMLSLYI